MAQISDKSAAYTIRIKTPVFQALKKAERPGFNYRKLSELAIRHFVEVCARSAENRKKPPES